MNRIVTRGFGAANFIISRGYNAPSAIVIFKEIMRLTSRIAISPIMLVSRIGTLLGLQSKIDLEEM